MQDEKTIKKDVLLNFKCSTFLQMPSPYRATKRLICMFEFTVWLAAQVKLKINM